MAVASVVPVATKEVAMRRKTVGDVMTREVVTISDTTPFKEIVRLMGEYHVSALPVLDGSGRPVGIVSEADLLLKPQYSGTGKPSFIESILHGEDIAKASGLVASQLMTTPVLTTTPGASIIEASKVLRDKRVKRLPVVDADGALVGIVSRVDLLSVFLRSDEDILDEIISDVVRHGLWIDESELHLEVHDGIVLLAGQLETSSLAQILVQFVQRVDGVVGVDDQLTFAFDDRNVRSTAR